MTIHTAAQVLRRQEFCLYIPTLLLCRRTVCEFAHTRCCHVCSSSVCFDFPLLSWRSILLLSDKHENEKKKLCSFSDRHASPYRYLCIRLELSALERERERERESVCVCVCVCVCVSHQQQTRQCHMRGPVTRPSPPIPHEFCWMGCELPTSHPEPPPPHISLHWSRTNVRYSL